MRSAAQGFSRITGRNPRQLEPFRANFVQMESPSREPDGEATADGEVQINFALSGQVAPDVSSREQIDH